MRLSVWNEVKEFSVELHIEESVCAEVTEGGGMYSRQGTMQLNKLQEV